MVEVGLAAVLLCVGVVLVIPDGGDGGVAALGHDAAQRPRVDQVAAENHVLDERVVGRLLAFAGAGGEVGCGAHEEGRRKAAGGDPGCGHRRDAGGREG